jgi:excisionase family DNA binding protein
MRGVKRVRPDGIVIRRFRLVRDWIPFLVISAKAGESMSEKRFAKLGSEIKGLNHMTAAAETGSLAPSLTDPAVGDTSAAHWNWIRQVLEQQQVQLDRIEKSLALSVEKETYTTEEVAERLGFGVWTVRQWCNKGRVQSAKKIHGRGRQGEWRIPHEELVRLQNEGPLPINQKAF